MKCWRTDGLSWQKLNETGIAKWTQTRIWELRTLSCYPFAKREKDFLEEIRSVAEHYWIKRLVWVRAGDLISYRNRSQEMCANSSAASWDSRGQERKNRSTSKNDIGPDRFSDRLIGPFGCEHTLFFMEREEWPKDSLEVVDPASSHAHKPRKQMGSSYVLKAQVPPSFCQAGWPCPVHGCPSRESCGQTPAEIQSAWIFPENSSS